MSFLRQAILFAVGALLAIPALPQTNIGSVTTYKLNGSCNAANAAGADMGAKINSCVAALPATGGAIEIPAGQFTGIATGVILSKPIRLKGAGSGQSNSLAYATSLTFNNGVTGITCQGNTAQFSTISGLYMKGNGGATADGILVQCHQPHIEDVVIEGFGRYGINTTASSPTGNANNWLYENIRALANGIGGSGGGFFWSGSDVNAGTCINCDASNNTGWGFKDSVSVFSNTFITIHNAGNTLGAVQVNGNSHFFLNPYTENGTGSTYNFTGTSYGSRAEFTAAAAPQTLTDTGAYNVLNYYRPTSGSVISVPSAGALPIGPGVVTSPTVYNMNSGVYDTAALALTDQTNAVNLMAYYPATGFKFLRPVNIEKLLPGLTLTDTTVGGHAFALQSGVFGGGIFSFSDQTAGVNDWIINPASTWPIQFLQNIFLNNGKVILMGGGSSGSTTFQAASVASGTITLPAATDTLVGKATTDVLTNKTFDTAGAGNVFSINGVQITANTGTGSNVLATSPVLVTPSLGVASATSVTATGAVSAATYASATNCSSSAAPAVCGSASQGSVTVAAAGTTKVVNTTAVTANSQIQLTFDSSLGTKLSVTCNTTPVQPTVSARTAGTSFTITVPTAPTTNPACFSYSIAN